MDGFLSIVGNGNCLKRQSIFIDEPAYLLAGIFDDGGNSKVFTGLRQMRVALLHRFVRGLNLGFVRAG